jgi:DJ-1/PfpI family protein
VSVSEYDGLVLPGGVGNPDSLRLDENAVQFVHEFFEQGKPAGAICHAPWLLIEAGVVRDHSRVQQEVDRGGSPRGATSSKLRRRPGALRPRHSLGGGHELGNGRYPESSAVAVAQLVEPLVVVQVVVGSSPISHLNRRKSRLNRRKSHLRRLTFDGLFFREP